MRLRRLLALVGVLVVLTGCQIDVHTNVTVDEDGSGRVEVAVGLDQDAVTKAGGDLAAILETDDLTAAGWTVTGPEAEADGLTWVRARKAFANPAQAGRVMDEIAGDDGPFRDFAVTRTHSRTHTDFTFAGRIDFQRGLESFSDPALAKELDGQPVGESVEAIEERIGTTLDKVFRFQVAVRLPGKVESNAPTAATNGAVWKPSITATEPLSLHAESRVTDNAPTVWFGLAGVAAFAAVLLIVVRIALWRRGDSR